MVENTPRVLAGRYEVGELVGRGGMAEVHIGHDTRLGRTVAIKVLRSDLARDPSFLTRFRREAQSAAALNHPAVVAVYDTGEDIHQNAAGEDVHVPFIVMEYVEGHTVRDILTDGAAVPIEEAVEITVGVLSALEYSHHAGIVHRDIKPANVMITPTGAVKVMDFGIARAMADSAATMTQTHAVIGTAQYLSPEQARGEQVDTRSDLYSTGCMLFELLTGRPPFQGDSPVAVAYQHVGQEPQRPSEVATDVPEVLDRITLKALTKDRDHRYSTAAEFRRDLEAAMRGGQVTAPMVGAAMMGATQVAGQPAYGATQVMTPGNGNWGPATAQQSPITPGNGYPGPQTRNGQREPEKKSKALMWWLLGIALAAVAAIIIAMVINGGGEDEPTTVAVPTISEGISAEEARSQIEAAGLTFQSAIDKESDLDEGQTTGQTDPGAGEEVEPNSTVTVYVAGAPGQVTLPELKNLSEADARAKLEELNLTVSSTESENSPDVSQGQVTKSEPGAGQTAQEGSDVVLYLSTGNTTLPNVVGQSKEGAEAQLANLGLGTIQWDTEESDDVTPGTVSRTDPEAGDVKQGTSVTVYIAEAPAPTETTVPADLVGKTLDEAQVACTGAQITCQQASEEASDIFAAGQVIRSDPAPGSTVDVGSYINLVISTGPEGGAGGEGDGEDIIP
ncbi:Stk1 family PASTA domain-containing Ser/Thr kinase [Promicromonospora sp. MEB111]|uniref:Stk1 family PASTA domain-containing Ser/Thr kinase n=1 Tax=Promicromonospora sp. MEB111 TaxID=3040301 RepID=UPI00254D62E8|nr:Stk1 family PASTA domain-containing Ser/Thr kinase [Promicromonospora sp. MEB111]